MIFAFVAAYVAYRRAKDYRLSGVSWGLISFAAFVGAQALAGLVIAVVIGFAGDLRGQSGARGGTWIPTALALGAGFAAVSFVLKLLDRRAAAASRAEELPPPPPSPPTFGGE